MTQADMEWSTFTAIIDRISNPTIVSLQGEGEPTLHHRFWEMVKYLVDRRHIPHTITNGSRVDVDRFDRYFPEFGVSLDTVDSVEASRLGRHGLSKVLEHLWLLRQQIPAKRISLMSVDYGQNLNEVRAYARTHGHPHVTQKRQQKEDYGRLAGYSVVTVHANRRSRCVFVEQPQRVFYTVDGTALPCCFMKDTSGFESAVKLRRDLFDGTIPVGCRGCAFLEYK